MTTPVETIRAAIETIDKELSYLDPEEWGGPSLEKTYAALRTIRESVSLIEKVDEAAAAANVRITTQPVLASCAIHDPDRVARLAVDEVRALAAKRAARRQANASEAGGPVVADSVWIDDNVEGAPSFQRRVTNTMAPHEAISSRATARTIHQTGDSRHRPQCGHSRAASETG